VRLNKLGFDKNRQRKEYGKSLPLPGEKLQTRIMADSLLAEKVNKDHPVGVPIEEFRSRLGDLYKFIRGGPRPVEVTVSPQTSIERSHYKRKGKENEYILIGNKNTGDKLITETLKRRQASPVPIERKRQIARHEVYHYLTKGLPDFGVKEVIKQRLGYKHEHHPGEVGADLYSLQRLDPASKPWIGQILGEKK